MSAPDPAPAPAPAVIGRPWLRTLGILLVATALAAGSGYSAWFLARAELQKQNEAAFGQLRELVQKQAELGQRLAQVETAAADAKILVNGAGLGDQLAELERLKAEVEQEKQLAAERAAQLEKTLREQIGAQERETAAAVAADLKLRALLFRAHGQVLKAKLDVAEGNRGLAKEEIALAVQTLKEAAAQATDPLKARLDTAATQAEQARTALVLESSTARDQLSLLWQQISALLGG